MKQLIYLNGFMHKVNIITLEDEHIAFSSRGYQTKELMKIFDVSIVTIYNWFNAWVVSSSPFRFPRHSPMSIADSSL